MSRLRRIDVKRDIVIIDVLTLILLIVISCVSVTWLRIVLGLPVVLFFPGYTLVAALFPRKEGPGSIERLTLSLGLSITVVPLIGLILNYTPWGIKLYPILLSLSFFILAMSILAWYKRDCYPQDDRFSVSFLYRQQLSRFKWRGMAGWDRVLSIVLIFSILGAIAALIYVVSTPRVGEKFPEFYILGMDGKAGQYPEELVVGEEENMILGIVNHEQETMSFRVEVWVVKGETEEQVNIRLDDVELEEIEVDLADEEEWEREVGFVLNEPCGSTTLSKPVTQGQKTLVVAGIEYFNVGDYIQIGSADEQDIELVYIEAIDVFKSEITIETELGKDHDRREKVNELQKIEFRLFKDGDSKPYVLHHYIDVIPI